VSIYSTAINFDATEHEVECARWVEVDRDDAKPQMIAAGRKYRRAPEQDCTCGAGPIIYTGSHVLPSDEDPRGGSFSACYIPGFIDRSDRPALGEDDFPPHPWLRVWVDGGESDDYQGSVALLDRKQVAELHTFLGKWLAGDPDAETA